MAGPAFVPPRWRKPAPLGYAAAIDSVGAVGSCWRVQPDLRHRGQQHRRGLPLAGRGHARLAAAAVALIGAVQCTYNTRQFLRSPSQVRDWWPEMTEDSELEALLRREQEVAFGRWEFWAKWTRTMHGAGILILLAGLALALPPTAGTGGAQGTMRWVAAGVAFAACAAEAAWMISVYGRRSARHRPPMREGSCPACQLTIAHQPGCPYQGLSMPAAWAARRRPPDGQ